MSADGEVTATGRRGALAARLLARADVGRERMLNFAMIAAAFLLILLPERDYVPIWDGRLYASCAMDAAQKGLSLESLRCAGHPAQGWTLLLALPQMLKPFDIAALHFTNIALGILALACIRMVLARVFPAPEHARQLDFVTLICAVHPVLLSTLIQPNVDFGVYVFFFAALAALLNGRWGWTAAAGTFLCFSKETGVLAYAVMLALHAVWDLRDGVGGSADRVRFAMRRAASRWVTAVPLILFAAIAAWRTATVGQSGIWKHTWQKAPIDGFNFFDLSEPIFRSYAAGLFVLGFAWVVSAVIGADACVGLWRMVRRAPYRAARGADAKVLGYLTTLTLLLTYLLTSFRTWSNLRYFALLYPLFLMMFFAALLRLGLGARLRGVVLGVVGALFTLAAYRSADPVSRWMYGTFSIGERVMYRMASITGEFGGPGKDELVYNLEFTGYHHVQNMLFQKMRPSPDAVVATSQSVRWNVWSALDSVTYRRTMRTTGVTSPVYADETDVARMEPARVPELWFLEFSNHADGDPTLERLGRTYTELSIVRVHARGHVLKVHHLVRRDSTVVP